MKRFKKWIVAGLLVMAVGMGLEVPKAEAGLSPQQIVQISQAGAKVLLRVARVRRGRR